MGIFGDGDLAGEAEAAHGLLRGLADGRGAKSLHGHGGEANHHGDNGDDDEEFHEGEGQGWGILAREGAEMGEGFQGSGIRVSIWVRKGRDGVLALMACGISRVEKSILKNFILPVADVVSGVGCACTRAPDIE